MVAKEDIIFAFDLDGTIAPYGEPVEPMLAAFLNTLGHIYIITGGALEKTEKATSNLKTKTIHALRHYQGNKSLDLSRVFDVTKKHFSRSDSLQSYRRNLCLALREHLHKDIYIGGRSTIDFMPVTNKGTIIKKLQARGKKVVYFYDCKWAMNEDVNNDIPAIEEAWMSIRTDDKSVKKDVKEWMKKYYISP